MEDFDDDDIEFLAAQARAEHVADDLRDEVERLKAINAELLEALVEAKCRLLVLIPKPLSDDDMILLGQIDVAIAKAKGEQQ